MSKQNTRAPTKNDRKYKTGGGRDKDMGRKGDMVRPWKPPVAFYVLMLVLGLYFAIITAGVWEDGDNIYTVFSKIMAIASKEPYHIPIKRAVSRIDILAQSVFFYEFTIGIFILLDLSKNRNFMRGKEYGTANWASVESINKHFMEKEHAS